MPRKTPRQHRLENSFFRRGFGPACITVWTRFRFLPSILCDALSKRRTVNCHPCLAWCQLAGQHADRPARSADPKSIGLVGLIKLAMPGHRGSNASCGRSFLHALKSPMLLLFGNLAQATTCSSDTACLSHFVRLCFHWRDQLHHWKYDSSTATTQCH